MSERCDEIFNYCKFTIESACEYFLNWGTSGKVTGKKMNRLMLCASCHHPAEIWGIWQTSWVWQATAIVNCYRPI